MAITFDRDLKAQAQGDAATAWAAASELQRMFFPTKAQQEAEAKEKREANLRERLLGAQVESAELGAQARQMEIDKNKALQEANISRVNEAMGNKELKPFLQGFSKEVLYNKPSIIDKAIETLENRKVVIGKANDYLRRNAMNITGEDYAKVQDAINTLQSNKHAGPASEAEKVLGDLVGQEDAKKYAAAAESLSKTGITPEAISNIQQRGGFNTEEVKQIVALAKQGMSGVGGRAGGAGSSPQSFASKILSGIQTGDQGVISLIKRLNELDLNDADQMKTFMLETGAKNSPEALAMKQTVQNAMGVYSRLQTQQQIRNRFVQKKLGKRGGGLIDDKGNVQVSSNVKLVTDKDENITGITVDGMPYVLDQSGRPVGIVVDGKQVPIGSEQHLTAYRANKLGKVTSGEINIDSLQARADKLKKNISDRISLLKKAGLTDEAKKLREVKKSLSSIGVSRDSLAALANDKRHKDLKKAVSDTARKAKEASDQMANPESVGDFLRGSRDFVSASLRNNVLVRDYEMGIQNMMATVGAENELAVDDLIDAERKMDDIEAEILSTYIPKESD